jgi:hypothetical protein
VTAALVMLFRPLVLILLLAIAWPFKKLIQVKMREGKLKSLLLYRINS